MARDPRLARWLRLYALLLRLYPPRFRARFAAPMAQTFADLARERLAAGQGLVPFVLSAFLDTSAGIVRERMAALTMVQKSILRPALVTAAILLVPAVAMLFTDAVAWGPFDFVVGFVLLFGAGLAYELVARRGGGAAYRAAVGIAAGASLLLMWANIAAGIIGSDDNPANLLFYAVPVVALAGAAAARLRPRGMTRALLVTALVQALVPLVALLVFRPVQPGAAGVAGVLALNLVFVLLFCVSALLFRRAGEAQAPQG